MSTIFCSLCYFSSPCVLLSFRYNKCMENNAFAYRLRGLRHSAGLKQQALGDIVGCSRFTVMAWESGTKTPSLNMMHRIAKALNTSVAYLSGEADFSEDAAPTAAENTARPDFAKSAGQIIRVPVYGPEVAACCGNGFGCMEQVTAEAESYVDMPAGFIGPYDAERPPFIIYADGDSMIDAGITDGAQVIINPADAVLDGDAALVDFAMTPVAHSIAIKRVYYLDAGAVEIRSACGDGWKRTFTRGDREEKSLRIIGKVEWIGHNPKRG